MLRESDIDSLNNHLASLSRDNQKHHENLQDVLERFKNLLEDYSSLKSDYEEVKEGRDKYKKQARGQVWNLRNSALGSLKLKHSLQTILAC